MDTTCKNKRIIIAFITLFFGYLGVHRFIKKDIKTGFIYLFTFGLFFVGWIKDTIKAFKNINEINHNDGNNCQYDELKYQGIEYYQDIYNVITWDEFNYAFKLLLKKTKRNEKFENFKIEYKKEFEYSITEFTDVQVMHEPDNRHDKNALKIVVNGLHIGYLSQSDQKIFLNYKYDFMKFEVQGGRRKTINDRKEIVSQEYINYYCKLRCYNKKTDI